MDNIISITPEVFMDSTIKYLIRMDGEEIAFVDSEKEAKLVVDSFAAAEQKRFTNEWVKVFREDLDDGKKSIISTQNLGYAINGSIYRAAVIDYISVGRAFLTKGRHELHDIPTPPPVPQITAEEKDFSDEEECVQDSS